MITSKIALVLAFAVAFRPFDVPQCRAVCEQAEELPEDSEKAENEIVYRIHGITPPIEWQKALRAELSANGVEWYMPYAVCQIWQESRWNPKADNGKDKGIAQQKAIYWAARAARYGVPDASIWDVNAQFRVYAAMMGGYLRATGDDVGKALSLYFYGSGEYAPQYVSAVMGHFDYLEEVTQ